MSGTSYDDTCSRCGGYNLMCYSDYKPFDIVSGICLDCGFEYHTAHGIADLEEVNQERENYELEPLAQLAKPTNEWLQSGYEPATK